MTATVNMQQALRPSVDPQTVQAHIERAQRIQEAGRHEIIDPVVYAMRYDQEHNHQAPADIDWEAERIALQTHLLALAF